MAPPPVPPAPQNNSPDPLAPLPEAPQAAPQGLPPAMIAQGPQAPPQGAPSAPQGPSPASQAVPPSAPQIAAALGGGGAANPAAPFVQPKPRVQGASLVQAMIPITASTESNNRDFAANGRPVTSPKGAKYAMQVMPATARKPGFGIKPAANDTPEEYNRVGRELLGKLTEKYGGDVSKAWAAYNAGSGRVDNAVRKHGEQWLAKMPLETRNYVAKNTAALGGEAGADGGYYPGQQQAQAEPLQPTGPVEYQTAEPDATALPGRPADRGAAQSHRMEAGSKLLALRDPALFERAMGMLDTGMGEQFAADRDALANNNSLDRLPYEAGVNDHFAAQNQKRAAAYEARGDERREHFTYGREMRGYAHDNNSREDTQGFQTSERLGGQEFTAGQNALDRAATASNVQAQIAGRKETEQEKRQAKLQNWLQTPQGSKMYQTATQEIQKFDGIVGQVDAFMELNAKQSTGGMLMNMPTGAGEWFAKNLNTNLQQMNQITEAVAPLLRQAGSGAMSDKDLAGFKTSVPNIHVDAKANRGAAQRMKLGVQRMTDFEMEKLAAQAEGRGVDFLREWNIFKSRVPYTSGKSFSEWKAENSYGADGSRK
jgi:hypothetical protein